ncbi:septation protein SepH [Nocardia yamanashiensis]|uniref:septation protein SepH n=1 Tax=Nocardia yamanashiensis TaxID=209247 RepID=UPI0022B82131|nr:septation protein SepH [Nocardia yamanashiensis]
MRELRVIGLTPDSTHIVCIDTETGQKYRLAADDKLRAAARGDLARFGQIEIEMEATMRPRDIQARIRAGASVEQVTEESGMPLSRVERFAYPVLLERARAAELAQKAHPVRNDGPAVETLIDIVAAAFAERGHNIEVAEWDAWKDEKGYWVAQLQWQAGRSVIAAHWRYQPDAHGGSVVPLDDPASDLIDPDFGRALRGLASILPDQTEGAMDPAPAPAPRTERAAEYEAAPARATGHQTLDGYFEQRAAVGADTVPVPAAAAAPAPVAPNPPSAPDRSDRVADRQLERPVVERPVVERPVVERQPAERQAAERPVAERPAAVERPAEIPAERPAPERPAAPAAPAIPAERPAAATTAEPAAEAAPAQPAPKPAAQKPNRAKRGGKAPMPSWEDVLLGVRSSGH